MSLTLLKLPTFPSTKFCFCICFSLNFVLISALIVVLFITVTIYFVSVYLCTWVQAIKHMHTYHHHLNHHPDRRYPNHHWNYWITHANSWQIWQSLYLEDLPLWKAYDVCVVSVCHYRDTFQNIIVNEKNKLFNCNLIHWLWYSHLQRRPTSTISAQQVLHGCQDQQRKDHISTGATWKQRLIINVSTES